MEHAKIHPSADIAIVTLDAEKAFYNVSFEWLALDLEMFGFLGSFSHFINGLYSSLSARVVAAGHVSNPIPLHKGTCQGCPLSPLLFILVIEPLSRYLNAEIPLHGIILGSEELRLTLFADDILIFTANPQEENLSFKKPSTLFVPAQASK